jgi:hypothetical protein
MTKSRRKRKEGRKEGKKERKGHNKICSPILILKILIPVMSNTWTSQRYWIFYNKTSTNLPIYGGHINTPSYKGYGVVAKSCEHSDQPLGFLTHQEFHEHLRDLMY